MEFILSRYASALLLELIIIEFCDTLKKNIL